MTIQESQQFWFFIIDQRFAMKLKTILVLLVGCLFSVSCAKKEEKAPKELSLKDQLAVILQQEFPEYTYAQHFIGNIDADAIEEDVVMVAERTCTDDEEKASDESKCRLTVFLKQQADQSYAVMASNNEVIGCSDCGGAGVGDAFLLGLSFVSDTPLESPPVGWKDW